MSLHSLTLALPRTAISLTTSFALSRMAECLSGHAMMPLATHGHQSCYTSSMMLSGTLAGLSLQTFLLCLEETTK